MTLNTTVIGALKMGRMKRHPGGTRVSLKQETEEVSKVWERLGLSRDDYMMLYWDFPNKKVMAIDHVGRHSAVGDIYDIATDDGHVVSFKIKG